MVSVWKLIVVAILFGHEPTAGAATNTVPPQSLAPAAAPAASTALSRAGGAARSRRARPAIKKKQAVAAASAGHAPAPRPGMVRSVSYTEAYQRHNELGQHLAIKITAPGARGKPGIVLVEAYNYARVALRAVDLKITMDTASGDELDAYVSANHVRPNLSGLTALKLDSPSKVVQITHAKITKMAIFDNSGRRINLNYYIDIIH